MQVFGGEHAAEGQVQVVPQIAVLFREQQRHTVDQGHRMVTIRSEIGHELNQGLNLLGEEEAEQKRVDEAELGV